MRQSTKVSLAGLVVLLIIAILILVPLVQTDYASDWDKPAAGNSDWIRDPYNPIIPNMLGELIILKEGGVFHLFYAESGGPGVYSRAKYHATASSINGIFIPDPANPILTNVGETSHGGGSILMDPSTHVPITRSEADLGISTDTTQKYWMFYANDDDKISIATNTSLDGAWTKETAHSPALEVSPGEWDSHRIGWDGIIVIEDRGTYKMLYQGDSGAYIYKVGLATSTNLIDWVKYSGNPVLEGVEDRWDERFTPSDIWKDGATFVLAGMGHADNAPYKLEALIIYFSTDLINWTASEFNPVAESVGEETNISDFALYRDGSRKYIFYEVNTPRGVYRMWKE